MKKRTLLWLILATVIIGGGVWMAQEMNIFGRLVEVEPSPREKQLAYLKEHEEEIKDFVKSQNDKIESVQIDWKQTRWEEVGNGTPQGGGEVVSLYGTFNESKESDWNIICNIENNKVELDSMTLRNGLFYGGELFE
ncbi:hypothetical protein ACVRXQ_05120 [Streptococcus panodentis]|uniref:Lipoprotein n=1 Tax=Streptococcus panodentis TaxID=1581472 RepID=A0ABS5AWC0_9STRE|nr:hypothetical protein [Streptococcus panodentis]MBP2620877.1 hypothetical protein [Streptococcus panodentis]